jgi:crotonobetainyl-CoA:carnitine CoA-transferase CaiB-like acyl-CoA transferase
VFFTMDGGGKVGPIQQVRTPLGAPVSPAPPPRLGQHTGEVLQDYGFSADEITALARS